MFRRFGGLIGDILKKRAFWVGGAQVWLRRRWGSGTRPYGTTEMVQDLHCKSARWESTSPPAGGEIPPQKTTEAAHRVAAQASLSCPCGAIHLLAPYEVAETCPLIRLAFGQPPSPQGEG